MAESEYNPLTQGRKWMITINNPEENGMTRDEIIGILHLFNPFYFCMADEIGQGGTYHTHIFIYSPSPIRFGTIKARFPKAHIDKVKGTIFENINYIKKEGKWENTKKVETKIEGSFFEFGTPPPPQMEKNPTMYNVLQDIQSGASTLEIISENPGLGFKGKDIDELRNRINGENFLRFNREVEVYYVYGTTGTGKTRGIFKKHPVEEICRITDYTGRNGIRFDAYHGQSVLVFEEFCSQIPIEAMLNYLDIYPLMLPARYADKIACYTTVYITSNLALSEQYKDVQAEKPETWKAFLRRITKTIYYSSDGTVKEVNYNEL